MNSINKSMQVGKEFVSSPFCQGRPEKYIDTKVKEFDRGAFYAWFPVKGTSMENAAHPWSIPEGSRVFVKEVEIRNIFSFPLNKPIIIMGVYKEEPFSLIKLITFLDEVSQRIRLTSLNPGFHDYWVQTRFITRLFVVQQILRPSEESPFIIN